MNERPLYQDQRITIITNPEFPDKYILTVRIGNEIRTANLGRGTLEDLAKTSCPDIYKKIHAIDDTLQYAMADSMGVLHVACCQAYIEEQNRIKDRLTEENEKLYGLIETLTKGVDRLAKACNSSKRRLARESSIRISLQELF